MSPEEEVKFLDSLLEEGRIDTVYIIGPRILDQQGPIDGIKLIKKLAWRAYNERRELLAAIQWFQAAIFCGSTLAKVTEYAEEAEEIMGLVKSCHFDLASVTWPGWNEPGIMISERDLELGKMSADQNLYWSRVLKKGLVPESRATWMVGAFDLAVGQFEKARVRFRAAEKLGRMAESDFDIRCNRAYLALTESLTKGSDEPIKAWEDQDVRDEETHDFLFVQVITAFQVFNR